MRALLLAPHHDDETLFASFICLRYRPKVVVVYGHSVVNGVDSQTREAEVRSAHGHINPDAGGLTFWPLSDASSTADEVEAFMWGLRDPSGDWDWDVVFAPAVEPGRRPMGRGHPQHDLVGSLASTVFADVQVEHYLTYTTPPVHRSRWGDEIEYKPEWLFRKHAALACHRSAAGTPSFQHFAEDMREYLA